MKLYYAPGACSLSPHIVAKEADIALDLMKVNLKTHQLADGGDYYAVNPKGYVPALQLDDGSILTEGVAVVLYLADSKPGANLVAKAGTMDRYRTVEWLTFINSELHKNFGPLFNPATPEDAKQQSKAAIGKRLSFVDKHLANQEFLVGGRFSVADAYLFTILTWVNHVGMHLKDHGHVGDYFKRIAERPAVHEALKEEGLVK